MRNFLLLCTLVLGIATIAQGSHFRYYTPRWNANGLVVDFTFTSAWRASFFGSCPALVGTTSTFGQGTQFFGDGSSVAIHTTWTSVDCTEDWAEGTFMVQNTYATAGDKFLTYNDCCRVGTLRNSPNAGWSMNFNLYVDAALNLPSATIGLLPIEPVSNQAPYSRDLTSVTAVPSGATNVVYSQGTDCGAPTQIGNLAVSSAGLLTWDPTVYNPIQNAANTNPPSDIWTACVYVDYEVGGQSYRIVVDWVFQTFEPLGNPPVWDEPPSLPDQTVFSVEAGDTVTFNMQASDPDGDIVTITATGLPQGAIVTNNAGATATTTFSWTPTAADTGFIILTYAGGDDNGGILPPRTIRINVDADTVDPAGECDDTQNVPLGSATAGVSSAGPCVELCFT